MRTLCRRLAALFRRGRLERDWDEEIAVHLAMQEEEFRRRGLSFPEARAAARREFGGVAQTAELYRERRGLPWIETTARDFRFAWRALKRQRGFTAAAVLSLALGIGANTAIFSMVYALLLRQLPVAHPEELVTLYRTGAWGRGFSSYPLYLEIRRRNDLFRDVAGRGRVEKVDFRGPGDNQREAAQRELVTGNYFALLGVAPAIGRLFTDEDNRIPHGHPLAVLSHDFWQRRFGGDPSILGQTITAGQDRLTVIGVAARGFQGIELDRRPDFWEPAMMTGGDPANPGSFWIWIIGRRLPGVSRSRVQAAVNVLFEQHLASAFGKSSNPAFRKTALEQRIEVREGGVGLSDLRENFGRPLWILMAAVGLVLLAACANVANLLLARGAARQKEIAVRLSLGATRFRLVRQALSECLLLAVAASAAAVLLAWWGERAILQFLPAASGDPLPAAPDAATFLFALAVGAAAALLFGLAPAWRLASLDPAAAIKSGGSLGARGHTAFRKSLVVAQVAFSVILVMLAGLFGHSLAALRSLDPGFRNRQTLAVSIEMPDDWKSAETRTTRERLLERMRTLPGVSLVSFGSPGPFLGGYSSASLRVPGSELTARQPAWVNLQRVAPLYFAIIGSTPLIGREFGPGDTADSIKVAVVNQAFVRAFLPGESHPLARVMTFDDEKPDPVSIVGVVRDMAHQGLRETVAPTVYLPATQGETSFGAVLLRSARPAKDLAGAIRREADRFAPGISVAEPKTIAARIDESIFQDRMIAAVGGFFGGLALLLAAIGLYGVMSYAAAQRSREIGIRIAMGARRGAVLWMVLRGSVVLVAAGLAIGIPIAILAGRYVAPVLFEIKPDDGLALGMTALVLIAVGLASALLPARRAASLDPMGVLRQE